MNNIPIPPIQINLTVQGVQPISPFQQSNALPYFQALPVGTFITGTVTGRDGRGNAIVKTPQGELLLSSELTLPNKSEIVLQIEANGANFRARIITLDGKSPTAMAGTAQRGGDTVIINQPLWQGAGGPVGTPLQQAAVEPTPIAKWLLLLTGNRQGIIPLILQKPADTIQQSLAQLGIKNMTGVLQQLGSNQGISAQLQDVKLPTPSPIAGNVLEPLAPPGFGIQAEGKGAPELRPSLYLQGMVVAHHGKETEIATPLGSFRVPFFHPLPLETKLIFTAPAISDLPESTTPPPATPTDMDAVDISHSGKLSRGWPALDEAIQVLTNADSTLAAQTLARAIPHTGSAMGSQMLFFLSALRGGDMRDWLGEKAVQILEEKGKGDLLKRLSGEFATLQGHWQEPGQSQWQMLVMPLVHGQHFEQARIFVRRDRQGSGSAGGEDGERIGTRFIVEVGLSTLGPMQMDGLVRKQKTTTLFDLMIRTHTPLAPDMQRDILFIFQDAAALTGFKGEVMFQTMQDFPVRPDEDHLHPTPSDVMI